MVIWLQCYTGAVGGSAGVKLEDQVIVTDELCELMCRYPYDERVPERTRRGSRAAW